MEDYIVRGIAANGMVRFFGAVSTQMVQKAFETHGLSPLAAVALGRTMTAAGMMSRMLKGEKDTLTVQIKGDGPLGGVVVVSDSQANVRGYVHNPVVYLPLNPRGKFDVAGALGFGYLNVIKDLGLKEPYVGYVDLLSGEIAEDITYYFASSEQIPSVVSLGVLPGNEGLESAGGYIIQLMPDADEKTISYLENRIGKFPTVTDLLSEGKSIEDILEMVLGEMGMEITEKSPCAFRCNCSRDRMERNLVSLGNKELQSMMDEMDQTELQCHFCNTKYHFTKENLKVLLDSMQNKE
ncbi:MAG: Hsp33 family molecular chaperone HslO [Clostridia bacterium]|nr:Hsp33 family molecular chaperone HslO [Clostridia bacterium]